MDKKELGFECEKAIRFLAEHMIDDGWKKPAFFHSIRVGSFLYQNAYDRDIVIAGFLHDILEDGSGISEETIRDGFGEAVLTIVKANSKDESIEGKQAKKQDLVDRCIGAGENAAIVKASDILDNFLYYNMTGNGSELKNHCIPYAELLLGELPKSYANPIFDRLSDVTRSAHTTLNR
ncbi:MAG: HD domain-containing protein [Candidatus Moraniibacteriota bacterium]